MGWALLYAGVAVISALATGWLRRRAVRTGMIDVPNRRSSHLIPTPRGGGAVIPVVTGLAAISAWIAGDLRATLAVALLTGGGAVALSGWLDDRFQLSARPRLVIQLLASMLIVWVASGSAGPGPIPPLLTGAIVVLGLTWSTNLFNFMDGIDGLAGGQAVFMAATSGVLLWLDGEQDLALIMMTCAAASLGFLAWNWPPAKIFMGDVGSGFLGYFFGAMAIVSVAEGALNVPVWLILGAVFIVDSSLTLLRRAMRRERILEPHRTHAYQYAARLLGGHRAVTVGALLINLVWLLPLAIWASGRPDIAWWLLLPAWAPLALVWWLVCRRGEIGNQAVADAGL